MNRIVDQFSKAFRQMEERGWDRIFVGVDIHETMMKPTWSPQLSTEYYDYALESLRFLSDDPRVCLILWSCSLPESNLEYVRMFKEEGVMFDYVNSNPECPSTDFADFESKLYFNVGLDDKFGFRPEEDWPAIYRYLQELFQIDLLKNANGTGI